MPKSSGKCHKANICTGIIHSTAISSCKKEDNHNDDDDNDDDNDCDPFCDAFSKFASEDEPTADEAGNNNRRQSVEDDSLIDKFKYFESILSAHTAKLCTLDADDAPSVLAEAQQTAASRRDTIMRIRDMYGDYELRRERTSSSLRLHQNLAPILTPTTPTATTTTTTTTSATLFVPTTSNDVECNSGVDVSTKCERRVSNGDDMLSVNEDVDERINQMKVTLLHGGKFKTWPSKLCRQTRTVSAESTDSATAVSRLNRPNGTLTKTATATTFSGGVDGGMAGKRSLSDTDTITRFNDFLFQHGQPPPPPFAQTANKQTVVNSESVKRQLASQRKPTRGSPTDERQAANKSANKRSNSININDIEVTCDGSVHVNDMSRETEENDDEDEEDNDDYEDGRVDEKDQTLNDDYEYLNPVDKQIAAILNNNEHQQQQPVQLQQQQQQQQQQPQQPHGSFESFQRRQSAKRQTSNGLSISEDVSSKGSGEKTSTTADASSETNLASGDNDSNDELNTDQDSEYESGSTAMTVSSGAGGRVVQEATTSNRDSSIDSSKSENPSDAMSSSNSSHNTVESASRLTIRQRTKYRFRKAMKQISQAVKNVQNKAEGVLFNNSNNNISEKSSNANANNNNNNNNDDDDDESGDSDDDIEANVNEATKTVKYRAARSNKSSHEFDKTQIIQVLHSNSVEASSQSSALHAQLMHQQHSVVSANDRSRLAAQPKNVNSIIWAMKFSPCGQLLATAGKDQLIRVWVLRSLHAHFIHTIKLHNRNDHGASNFNLISRLNSNGGIGGESSDEQSPFHSKPLRVYTGHTADILDLSWSKSLFLVSASSDKSVKLWHVYKSECLCSFQHSSIVSAISFHPKNDRYFISACLDGQLRLWNIAEKKVMLWNDLNNMNQSRNSFITAISFCQSGKTIAVGTHDAKCILFHTEHLKYYSLIHVRSTRGRNSKGSKITGIEVLNTDENKILITSNDSRIRLFDLRDLSLICKYKGFSNSTVHIKASLSADDRFIVSGSKNKCTYIWKTNYHFSMLTSGRRDRNNYWERLQAHNAIVTCALFAPKPHLIFNQATQSVSSKRYAKLSNEPSTSSASPSATAESHLANTRNLKGAHVLISAAGCDGVIKIFTNRPDLLQ